MLEPVIHTYLRQLTCSEWSTGQHLGMANMFKRMIYTSKKCLKEHTAFDRTSWSLKSVCYKMHNDWKELAPVLIRQFIHSYWPKAMAGTPVPHPRFTRDAHANVRIRSFHQRALPFHSWRGVLSKEIIEQMGTKIINGNKNVLGRYKHSV